MLGPEGKPRPLVAGNWKMNGGRQGLAEATAVNTALAAARNGGTGPLCGIDVLICPPATLVMVMSEVFQNGEVRVGAQDCHVAPAGAHTGDISAEILADAGAEAIIVGHSERRADHGETDAAVRAKQAAVHRAGLTAIVCIGETAGQRAAGQTLDVVKRQLERSLGTQSTAANTVIAYEPVWAIGTGLTPTSADVAEVHAAIRERLEARFGAEGRGMRILYGGSVKPQNARELMAVPNVDGALVGGASLKAADFLGILEAYA
jgi:triosephosphate isomerase